MTISHTEDTKAMTVENLLKDIDYWKSQERNGHSFEEMNKAVEALKECVRTTLTLFASQVREERDREIVNHFSKYLREWQDGMNDNSPSAKLTWVIDEIKSITTLTPKI